MEAATTDTSIWSACEAHPFDPATGTCAECRRRYCASCLVYPHGRRQHPLCIPCALTAAGVRLTAARTPLPGRGLARLPGIRSSAVVRAAVTVALGCGTGMAGLNILNALG